MKMNHYRLHYSCLLLCLFLISCDKCPNPSFTAGARDGWTLSANAAGAGELNPPRNEGGNLVLGHNNGVTRIYGHPDSKGTKEINCGKGGSKCNIWFDIGGTGGYNDNEKIRFKFTYDGNKTYEPPAYARFAGNPYKVSVPGCGSVTIEVSVDAGDDSTRIDSYFTVRLRSYECQDCDH